MRKPHITPGFTNRVKSWLTGKYVENGATASQNIPAGKWVIWKGQMCQAKSAITTGDTLSSTNLDITGDEGAVNAVNGNLITGSVPKGSGLEVNAEWRVLIPIPADSDVNALTLWIEMVGGGYPAQTLSYRDNSGAAFYIKNLGPDRSTNVIAHWSIRK